MSSKQSASNKDPNTAMVIEIVAGYFGFLGIGYLYAGRTVAGLGVTQLAVSSFPCHYDSRSNPTPARGGKVDESSPV
jgi:hypothetical protein